MSYFVTITTGWHLSRSLSMPSKKTAIWKRGRAQEDRPRPRGSAETTLRTATKMKVTTKVVTKMETDPLRPGGLPIARTAGAGATGVSTASCDTSSALCSGGGASLVPGCLPNLHIKHQNVRLET